MRTKKIVSALSLVLLTAMMFTGCGSKVEGPFIGDWAYVHDSTETVLSLQSNGKAKYQGNDYKYTTDNDYIYLKSSKGEEKIRYKMDGEKLYIYLTTEYTYDGEGTPDGIVGNWVCTPKKWSFEFTDQGTFKEDGYFPGYYSVDTEAKTVKLVYNDHFEDTVFYFEQEGNTLTVEYPWETVHTQTEAEAAKKQEELNKTIEQ